MNNNTDLETRVLELEKRVKKLENINKMRMIFNIVGIVIAIVLIILIFYFLGKFYSSLLDNEVLSSFMVLK